MRVIVTVCSKDKDRSKNDMPAYQRYKSPRIKRVRSIARKQNLPFYILSGEYGLIGDDEIIPYYDHLLNEDEVHNLSLLVKDQVKLTGITSIEFYAEPRSGNWIPYYKVIEHLIDQSDIKLDIILT